MTRHQQRLQSTDQEPRANLYATAVGLPEEARVQTIQTLNQSLADTTDLQSQAKFAHWNVKGLDFYQLHLLFDELAETLSEHVDLLAERATALGGQAMGTTRIAASTSRIPEPPVNAVDETEYLEWLTDHVARHANFLRADIERAAELGDEDAADLFTELSREVDKYLYFLESHLQSGVQTQISATASRAGGPGWTGAGRGTDDQRQAGDQQSTGAHGGAPAHRAATDAPPGTRAGTGQQFAGGDAGRFDADTQSPHPPRESQQSQREYRR